MASVKVAVRVRPFNEREISLDSKCIIRMDGNKTIINNLKLNDITNNLQNEQQIINASEKFKEFVYDASYWSFDSDDPHFVSQQAVYNDLGKMTVNNAFDGYNACLCAYGQTGSGKSYSMMGQPSNLEQEGLIPRICKALFERIQSKTNSSNASSNVSYRTEVSYLEIYNEKVRDLLRTSQKNQQGQHNLKVREHPKTGVYVQDLSQHIVCNYDDIEELINKGNLNRTTASTNMNDVSSRSHAIFTVKFAQAKLVENIPSETVSKMNLVDLAGSERADATGATGIRLKEGGNINKSLLTFINVISTLADLSTANSSNQDQDQPQRKHYIPYRDSILTWLLKDSLGGNSKTVILAAISPADVNYVETLSTLRYANRAKNIINKPTINEDPNVKLIKELRAEIVKLKLMLQNGGSIGALDLNIDNNNNNHNNDNNNNIKINQDDNTILLKQIDLNQLRLDELTNQWKCKWQKFHQIFDEFKNLSVEKITKNNGISVHLNNQPYLISVNNLSFTRDINQSILSVYPIKDGKTSIGSMSFDPDDENESFFNNFILINDTNNIKDIHCYLNKPDLNSKIFLHLNNNDCLCQLNDRILNNLTDDEINNGIELKHLDYLFIGDKYLFQYYNHNDLDLIECEMVNDKQKCLNQFLKYAFQQKLNESEHLTDYLSEIKKLESIIDEQRKQIHNMNEQIELNNKEMIKLREMTSSSSNQSIQNDLNKNFNNNFNKNINKNITNNINNEINSNGNDLNDQKLIIEKEIDEREIMQNLVEKFERDEKLLSECMKDLNKSQQTQLKSLIFELQNLRLKQVDLENEMKKSRADLEKEIEKLSEKRDLKLSELNKERELILKNKQLVDLKLNMSHLNDLEIESDKKISSVKRRLEEDKQEVDRLKNILIDKKNYDSSASLDEMREAENEMIAHARNQLELVKKEKKNNYLIIEAEFEKAKQQMINEFETNNQDFLRYKQELSEICDKEFNLKKFLEDGLYENDEEKCLVENELTELLETKETVEDKLDDMRAKNRENIEQQMSLEYKGLNDLKEQDLEEIKQDEERINLLYESSIENIENMMKAKHLESINTQNELKKLECNHQMQMKKMNELLAELEIMENKRLVEESRIFNQELKVANENKMENEKLNAKLTKIDSFYRKKIDDNLIKKANIKPKICNIVGNYKGIQLYEADFNPKMPTINESYQTSNISPTHQFHHPPRSSSFTSYQELLISNLANKIQPPPLQQQTIKEDMTQSLYLDDTTFDDINSYYSTNTNMTKSFSGSISNLSYMNGTSSMSGSTLTLNISDPTTKSIKRDQTNQAKFQTHTLKMLGIDVQINEALLLGKRTWDEHYEYLIEIRLQDEYWFVLRRYSKIRQLHDQMSLLYPSLSRIVFPMRLIFNSSDKQIIERQVQLEHYLKCFLEILINDSSSPLYVPLNETSLLLNNSASMNSLCSSNSNQTSPSSPSNHSTILYNNTINLNINNNFINKSKLCSFCPFFEQNQTDLSYLNKFKLINTNLNC